MKIMMIFFCLIFILHLSATIINIPADQSTIQEGINVTVDGDTVLVQTGNYNTSLDFMGKAITLASLFLTTQDPSYISDTTIDGYDTFEYIILQNINPSEAVIIGFKLTWLEIYLEHSKLVVKNCDISGPSGEAFSIFEESEVLIESCEIHEYRFGKSIVGNNSNIAVLNTIFYDNGGYGGNGGISLNGCNTQIINSVIYESIPDPGCYDEAITCSYSNLLLLNSIMWSNANGNINISNGSNVAITHSCLQNGQSSISGNISTLSWMDGNIETNPNFTHSTNNDLSLNDESLCIGTGIGQVEISEVTYFAPVYDILNNPRPNPVGSMPDIGAYENLLGEPVGITNHLVEITDCQLSNFPNPFNPTTTIEFSIPKNSDIYLSIFNIKGQKVKTLADDEFGIGSHSLIWNGDDDSGKPVSSGIYYYKMNVNDKTEAVNKCLLLK